MRSGSPSTRHRASRWSTGSSTVVRRVAVRCGGRRTTPSGLPAAMRRTGEFLTQSVFNRYHSEHEMLRYLRRLADKDLALDRTMIPLGSCTMKLNATTEMVPISWPEFADIHPYAPADQTAGYRLLIDDLERRLAEITGYDAVSLQPNAGSQGEFAGLLAIRAYHRSRGDAQRTVCLIPSSAHGTNAASAVMAGFDVVVVACDEHGNIDDADLAAKIAAAADRLGRDHGHLPVDARCLRGGHHRSVPGGARGRRPGVRRRCQPQRPRRRRPPGCVRRRRQPLEPAQDVLHPPRRGRPGCRPDRGPGPSRRVPPR